MKKMKRTFLYPLLALVLFCAACSPAAVEEAAPVPGEAAILTSPQDGQQVNAGEWLIVTSSYAAASPFTMELLVDGKTMRADAVEVGYQKGSLQQAWKPMEPGEHTLQIRMQPEGGSPIESAIVTIVVNQAQSAAIPTIESVPSITPMASVTPATQSTPTPSNPTATARLDVNCRFGPGTVYEVLGFLLNGQSAPINARNLAASWWRIKLDNGTLCWVDKDLVEVNGDTSGVPIVEAPPTPTPTPAVLLPPILKGPEGALSCRSEVDLAWLAASHPNGIDHYDWWLSSSLGTQTGNTDDLHVKVTVVCGVKYEWKVRSVDNKGNPSAYSPMMEFKIK